MRDFKYKYWLAMQLLLVSLTILGCSTEKLPTITTGEPLAFTLLGEFAHQWEMQVTSGKSYEVVVTRQNGNHPINRIAIVVRGRNWVFDNRPQLQGESAVLNFSAPEDGRIVIKVISAIGMIGEDWGEHTLEIHEIQ